MVCTRSPIIDTRRIDYYSSRTQRLRSRDKGLKQPKAKDAQKETAKYRPRDGSGIFVKVVLFVIVSVVVVS